MNYPVSGEPDRAQKSESESNARTPESGNGEDATDPILDVVAFAKFVEHREQIGKPLSAAAREAAAKRLATFGPDQMAVVEQAIANKSQSLLPLPTDRPGTQ